MIESGGSSLLAEIRKLYSPVDTVPKGWKKSSEWAKEWGCSDSAVKKYLRIAVANGLMEVRKFRVCMGTRNQPVPHYRKK